MQIFSIATIIEAAITGALVGPVVSFLAERVTWFQRLSAAAKWWVILVVSFVVPALGMLVERYVPTQTLDALGPLWNLICVSLATWAATQASHGLVNRGRGNGR